MNMTLGPKPRTARQAAALLLLGWSAVALGAGACSSGGDDSGGGGDDSGADGGGGTNGGGGSGGEGPIIGTGGSGADGGGGIPGPDGSCGQSPFAATARKVNVLVVLDKSGSMQDPLPGTADAKWDTMKAAVGAALDGTKSAISYGLELFPQAGAGEPAIPLDCADFGTCCGDPATAGVSVDVAPGATAVPLIEAALAATAPGGATPSAGALSAALDYFTKGAGKGLAGDRYVLFATDGGPNCDSDATCAADACTTNLDGKCSLTSLPDGGDANCCDAAFDGRWRCLDASGAEASVAALATAGIPTFVVGIPGSEAYSSTLDALALAGGVPAGAGDGGAPRYFAVSASGGAAALTDVLESITKSLIKSCRLELASDPPDRTLLNVEVDGVAIARGAANGWDLDTKTSPPTVVLQGTTCARVESEGAESISVVYGCPTVE